MSTELTEMTALTEREQKLALMTAQATTQGMMQMLAPMLNGMQQMTQMNKFKKLILRRHMATAQNNKIIF